MIGLSEAFQRPGQDDPLFLPRKAERLFSSKGALVTALGLEHRAQQEIMALTVAQAFATDNALLFEAPTGVGKSLAYLLPGIVHAMERKRQLLVSTHTKALQEQIREKDLKLCRTLFKSSESFGQYSEFKAAVLMGKGNYLCGTRLREAMTGAKGLFPTPLQAELERILRWSTESLTGLAHELAPSPDPEVWEQVSADSPVCNNRNCTPESCHYRRARKEVEEANVLIVNHSLLFALIGAGYQPRNDVSGVLHPNDFVVLDEAHTIPAVATDHFGIGVSDFAVRRQLLRLYNPNSGKGLLKRHSISRALPVVESALNATAAFFGKAASLFLSQDDICPLPHPDWLEPLLHEPLCELVSHLSSAAKQLNEGPARDELSGAASLLSSYNGSINECIQLEKRDHVYWIERIGRRAVTALRSAPLDVAPYLRDRLINRGVSVLLTSATLDNGDGMENFASRTGASAAEREQVSSPFDLERNMRVFIAEDASQGENGRLDLEWLTEMIQACCLKVRGGSLVLFTSHRDLREVAGRLEKPFNQAGRQLFVQGQDGSPSALRQKFTKAGNAILFGTDSFWTGVDVPGPALSHVVVTRLPFENPTHPVAQARSHWVSAQGGNPFLQITVPEAVTKFRQGIGRLIRTHSDKGTLTLLDSRILRKEYGKRFLAVLPSQNYRRFSRANVDDVFVPLEESSSR